MYITPVLFCPTEACSVLRGTSSGQEDWPLFCTPPTLPPRKETSGVSVSQTSFPFPLLSSTYSVVGGKEKRLGQQGLPPVGSICSSPSNFGESTWPASLEHPVLGCRLFLSCLSTSSHSLCPAMCLYFSFWLISRNGQAEGDMVPGKWCQCLLPGIFTFIRDFLFVPLSKGVQVLSALRSPVFGCRPQSRVVSK